MGFQEFNAVVGDGIGSGFDVAPDGSGGADFGDVEGEAFYGQPGVVVEGGERLKDAVPGQVAGAGGASVVFGDMDVLEMGAGRVECGGDVFLFDVGVEGVEEDPNTRVVDLIAKADSVAGGVQEVSLEAVQGFDGESDAVGVEDGCDGLIRFDGPVPFVVGAAAAGEIANGTVERSGDDFCAAVGRGFDGVGEMPAGFRARGGIRGNQAEAFDEDGAGGQVEVVRFEIAADQRSGESGGVEQRDFDAIETGLLDSRELSADGFVVGDGPDERVDSDFHGRA